MVLAAPITQSSQAPVITAATDASSANVLMLRSDDVGSDRLSWIRSTSCLSPSWPEALICSIRSCRARAYVVSVSEPDDRSAPMMICRTSPESSPASQPASQAASIAGTTTEAVRRRMGLTADASSGGSKGWSERHGVCCGRDIRGNGVRSIAPNLANVKVPGQAAVDRLRGIRFPHSGWNLDGQASPYDHVEW